MESTITQLLARCTPMLAVSDYKGDKALVQAIRAESAEAIRVAANTAAWPGRQKATGAGRVAFLVRELARVDAWRPSATKAAHMELLRESVMAMV